MLTSRFSACRSSLGEERAPAENVFSHRTRGALYDERVTSSPEMPTAQHPPATPPKRPVRVWDIVVTIVFLFGLAALTLVVSIFGLYLSMAADSCGVRDCDTNLIAVGMLLAAVMPWVLLGIAVISSIVLLILRRLAFWVPLVAAVLIVAAFFVGGGLATAGVPPA